MENKIPKNVRQIGNVSDTPKIYVEDYVDTYLNHLSEETKDTQKCVFLTGHTLKEEEQESVYISGAVSVPIPETQNGDIVVTKEIYQKGEEECKTYFPEDRIIGWGVIWPTAHLELNKYITRIHGEFFPGEGTVLILRSATEKEEAFYSYKYKELLLISGHYIYYEKNTAMQNYLIKSRREIGVTPSEAVEDKAAKEFRYAVRDKMAAKERRRSVRAMYGASAFLIMVVFLLGVITINSYDGMQTVQKSIKDMEEKMSKTVEAKETVKEEPQEQETVEEQVPESVTASTEAVSTIQEMSEDIYVVEKGDTLAKISKKIYGDIGHVDAICRMNGLKDGNLIFIGQKLLLP